MPMPRRRARAPQILVGFAAPKNRFHRVFCTRRARIDTGRITRKLFSTCQRRVRPELVLLVLPCFPAAYGCPKPGLRHGGRGPAGSLFPCCMAGCSSSLSSSFCIRLPICSDRLPAVSRWGLVAACSLLCGRWACGPMRRGLCCSAAACYSAVAAGPLGGLGLPRPQFSCSGVTDAGDVVGGYQSAICARERDRAVPACTARSDRVNFLRCS